jgi:hypothetical protein
MATLSFISFVTASPMIVLLVLYWFVPLGRGAVGTGNQLSSDHFERAVDYCELGLQETETFPDLRNIVIDDFLLDVPHNDRDVDLDADLGDSVVHCV